MHESQKHTFLIVLAAGRGKRMQNSIDCPKPLALLAKEPLLQRTLRQFHEIGFNKTIIVTGHEANKIQYTAHAIYPEITFIHNKKYIEDKNIYSLLLALREIPAGYGAIIVEADVVLSDAGIMRFALLANYKHNFWTACGHFSPGQVGGIILPDNTGKILQILYSEYDISLSNWYKNLGLIHITPAYIAKFRSLLEDYVNKSLNYYYMTPWQEHLHELPAYLVDLGSSGGATFNTPQEYEQAKKLIQTAVSTGEEISVILCASDSLKHIEAFDQNRVNWLANKIAAENIWTKPLAVSREHNLVMDGQHRLRAAITLGLNFVPAVFFSYSDICVHSLRPEYTVTVNEIIERALSGNIYPYKTAKHTLPPLPDCNIPLDILRQKHMKNKENI